MDTITLDATGAATRVTRTYPFPGGPSAVRTATAAAGAKAADAVHWQPPNPQGTGLVDIAATSMSLTRRGFTPFGADRPGADSGTWTGVQGFVGGLINATDQLTTLGVRVYDPTLGRFLSVDPILDTGDPQSVNGYAYADNDPVTKSDPTGAICENGPDGSCHSYVTGLNYTTHGVSDAKPARGDRIAERGKGRRCGQPYMGSRNSVPTRLDGLSTEQMRGIATREDAVQLRDWYAPAHAAGTGGRTAEVRVGLAQKVVDAWDTP